MTFSDGDTVASKRSNPMKSRNVFIALGVAAALAAGAYGYTALAQGGPGYGPGMMGGGFGPGMMGGNGPGFHMRGFGGGQGAGPWNCPALGQNEPSGPAGAQDQVPGQGYGPGYRMRGWGGGYGPGMMQGNGPGYGRGPAAQADQTANQNLNLTTDQVKTRMEGWLNWRGNPRLKVGDVKEKDADTITADIVTKDNSLVQRFIINRHTGAYTQDNS
jgi:hypothetical protein